jgi:hypothetical protein
MHCSVSGVVEGGHSFCPFGEVINGDNDVFVTIAGGGITSHEVDVPFKKRVGSNDRVKKRGGGLRLYWHRDDIAHITSRHECNHETR